MKKIMKVKSDNNVCYIAVETISQMQIKKWCDNEALISIKHDDDVSGILIRHNEKLEENMRIAEQIAELIQCEMFYNICRDEAVYILPVDSKGVEISIRSYTEE
jgi:hypothetical protein